MTAARTCLIGALLSVITTGCASPERRADTTAALPAGDAHASWNVPSFAGQRLDESLGADSLDVFTGLDPHFQRGRFDDDTLPDVALLVVAKASGKRGIAFIHAADSSVHVIGAGRDFGNGGDDFECVGVWRIESRTARPDITPAGRELLFIGKPESAGAMIWWNGRVYVWTQHGD
jgi:hypothetical protein